MQLQSFGTTSANRSPNVLANSANASFAPRLVILACMTSSDSTMGASFALPSVAAAVAAASFCSRSVRIPSRVTLAVANMGV